MIKLPFFFEKKLNRLLHTIHLTADFVVTDANGKIVYKHSQFMHSLTENFLAFLYTALGEYTVSASYGFTAPHTSNVSCFDTTSTQVAPAPTNIFSCKGDGFNSNSGIVVGTGAPLIAPLTRNLSAKITHGNGAGQLWYGQQMSVQGVTVLGNVSSLSIQRNFANSSGADILVSEFGLMAVPGNQILHAIDPITPAVNVPITRTLTVIINFSITT